MKQIISEKNVNSNVFFLDIKYKLLCILFVGILSPQQVDTG